MKKILFILVLGMLILTGCKFKDLFKKETKAETEDIKKTYEIKVPVTVSKAIKSDLIKYVKTNGIAVASSNAVVFSELRGSVSKLKIEENQAVNKGDLLLEIDASDLELQLREAKLSHQKALAEYNAWMKLGDAGEEDLLKIQTGLSAAEIQVERIELEIAKTKIQAPFNGIVSDINVVLGEQVNNGNELFSIIDNSNIKVKGQVLESELTRINIGAKTRIRFAAIPGKVFEGTLVSIAPKIDQVNRTCEVDIALENESNIKNGMFCEMKIEAEIYLDQILVYKDALLVRNGRKLLFAIEDKKAKWQYVETGEENDRFISITDGVKENQDIVIEGNFSLAHDAIVNVKEEVDFTEFLEKF